ncbi:30S ribosomal protein S24e [Staphylothermus hellenicus]|uniref:Small ribosomal subunit protein eS24 n=1 Tax=Staphylothermus hellenicus (strain DSM 12710 / JCM 10830 / BK20S6-10-b1 / P8) TaxID=591019 RepID=D7DAC0_STAHD|nr:30S ribosomal protein S24e [Staphylothermus hellenicus]ADI32716.1 Ribosomal protein S24e [Staphylothermus hellenicus DSM 12710]
MGKTVKIGEFTGEIVVDRYNPLVKRREVVIRIAHIGKSTPSRGLIRHETAKIYGVEAEKVYVRGINTEYGLGVSNATIHIYDSVERAKQFEPPHIIRRNEYASQSYQLEQMMKEQGMG